MPSIFKNAFAEDPQEEMDINDFLIAVKSGRWKKLVENVRSKLRHEKIYKAAKAKLPAISVSGTFKSRSNDTPLSVRLLHHSGFICIDVDKKDNPKVRLQDVIDKDAYAEFISCSGEGKKIIYKCSTTTDAATHRRIFDGVVQRLEAKGIEINVDPIVKSIASLQFVSYDPAPYLNYKTKLTIKPLTPLKKSALRARSEDIEADKKQLQDYIDGLGDTDVTKDYENWLLIAFGLSYSLAEEGRKIFHRLSSYYPEYSKEETDNLYDACLERNAVDIDKPVTLSTVYQILIENTPKVTLRHLAKKYNKSHAVGVGEDVTQQEDLGGFVRYKLFLFKKIFDKETNTLIELIPAKLNLNEFDRLLNNKGLYRYENIFVRIIDNIVEKVDKFDINVIVTEHIEKLDGDYIFVYNKTEFKFGWEELAHLWREIRAQSSIFNQIGSSLRVWMPTLLVDTPNESYLPFLNGVVKVTAKGAELLPYAAIKQQIWRERIIPRNYINSSKVGMFEEFFAIICGKGKTVKEKFKSELFLRNMWYFGYMLQGTKRQSLARAWLIYDNKTGNNGRSGKTIIGQAIGKIRSMVTIDGKQVDFKNRFAFQAVQPWTNVVFIDDPAKHMSLVPLFNMISGSLSAEKKNKDPLELSVKFVIASNWILEGEGSSERGRQFVTQVDDFYIQYAKEKDTIMPIVHYHGKEFFTDWDEKDWASFDSFAIRCLIYHLSNSVPESSVVGSAMLTRFIQNNSEEMFYNLSTSLQKNHLEMKTGPTAIACSTLTDIIREYSTNITVNAAGRIAREFLGAIGAGELKLSTIRNGPTGRMGYFFNKRLKDLDFGGRKTSDEGG